MLVHRETEDTLMILSGQISVVSISHVIQFINILMSTLTCVYYAVLFTIVRIYNLLLLTQTILQHTDFLVEQLDAYKGIIKGVALLRSL